MMQKIFILFVMLFVAHMLFSQVLYKEGIVKGKKVTYEVSRDNKWDYIVIRNMNNPDTTFCEVPHRDIIPPQLVDINMQVAEIIHDYLSPEEIDTMDLTCVLGVTFRLDTQTRNPLQITNFFYFRGEPFWANFSPDRLYELEQIILKKLELPTNLQETYFEFDFCVRAYGFHFRNIERVRETREVAVKGWQRNDKNKEQGETYLRCFK